MNDDELNKLFSQAPNPEPDESVTSQIKHKALAAFKEAAAVAAKKTVNNSQGNEENPRLTSTEPGTTVDNIIDEMVNTTKDERNQTMNTILKPFHKRPLWVTGLAASVAMVAVLMVVKNSPEPYQEGELRVASPKPGAKEGSIASADQDAAGRRDVSAIPLPAVAATDTAKMEWKKQSAEQAEQSKVLADTLARLSESESVLGVSRTSTAPMPSTVMSHQQAPAGMAMKRIKRADAVKPVLESHRDRFEHVDESPVKRVDDQPVSTFSIDVDTASYSFVRRQLNRGVLPAEDAVRVEEMVNYFDYAYPGPESKQQPFATYVNVIESPWQKGNQLVHIGIKGYDIDRGDGNVGQPDSNLVFLLDVSGSMGSPDKLPLVKQSMGLLLDSLKPTDKVSIVVYAGAAGAVLEPTAVKEKAKILAALENLQAGGSTAGGQGLALAYSLAEQNFDKKAVNRIILATDGDFNVGITQDERLEDFVARKRESGIYLSVFGFGEGNYQDALMQKLAQNGNGIAAYIDTLSEAQKILINEATSALFPIANDVKIQVEFNPSVVSEYRLIGYETRALKRQDFNNDKVDAGDIGAGHTVTAIYEITPVNANTQLIDDLRYQQAEATKAGHNEIGFLKLRYKRPGEKESSLITTAIEKVDEKREFTQVARPLLQEINFSVAVAGFAQLLRGGQYTAEYNFDDVISAAQAHKGSDEYGYRTEFVQLVRKAKMARAM